METASVMPLLVCELPFLKLHPYHHDLLSAVFLAPEVTTAGQKGEGKLSADTKKQVAHIHCMQQTNKIL